MFEIMNVPGIIGAYVCDPSGNILNRYVLDDVEEEMLSRAHSFLFDAVEYTRNNQMNVSKIEIEYELGKVLIKLLEKYYVLVMSQRDVDLEGVNNKINELYGENIRHPVKTG